MTHQTKPAASPGTRRALVHNAITKALSDAGDWVPLSVRIAATRAALAKVDAWHAAEPAAACAHCGSSDHTWDDCEAYTRLVAEDATAAPAAVSAAVAPPTSTTHGLSIPHADALWDAIATPGPDRESFDDQHANVCRVVREILDDLLPAPSETAPSHRAELRDEIVKALGRIETVPPIAHRREQADHVLAVLYREWPWLRAEAEDAEPTDRTALRERIAQAIEDAPFRPDTRRSLQLADAVLAVLPPTTDRAAVLRDGADLIDATYTGPGLDRYTRYGADLLRRKANETATKPSCPVCAHCGQSISRVTGTLTTWWIHAPGGNALCHPGHAARSHRATPQATSRPVAGVRQDEAESCAECGDPKATHREGDDPVSPGYCSACPDDDAWHDYLPAAGARQDGAET